MLSTQNPVDVDYKALSNAGTWMVGRLQTDRDKQRLLDGMSAAAGGVDVHAVGDTISGLGKREFVLRRAGKDRPEVFTTRWAMSYLRGPMTRDQIKLLTPAPAPVAAPPSGAPLPPPTTSAGGIPAPPPAPPTTAPSSPAAAVAAAGSIGGPQDPDVTPVMPEVAGGVGIRWVDPASPWLAAVGGDAGGTTFEAALVARVALRYDEVKADLVADEEYEAVLFPIGERVDVTTAVAVDYDDRDLLGVGPAGATYRIADAPIAKAAFWKQVQRDLVDHLTRSLTMELPVNRTLKLYGRAGELSEDFAARCALVADDRADVEVAALRDKYETKVNALRTKMAAATDAAEVAQAQQDARSRDDMLSSAGSILGGLLGGRKSPWRSPRSARPGRRQVRQDVRSEHPRRRGEEQARPAAGRAGGDRGRAVGGPHRHRRPLGRPGPADRLAHRAARAQRRQGHPAHLGLDPGVRTGLPSPWRAASVAGRDPSRMSEPIPPSSATRPTMRHPLVMVPACRDLPAGRTRT